MSLLEGLVIAWALGALAFTGVALWRLRGTAVARGERRWPSVVLLRPLDAPSRGELETLAAPIDYPAPLEQVVLSPYRPVLPPGVRWIPSDPVCQNRKVGHLLYGLEVLPIGDRVVLAIDGDVRVDGALVRALVAPLLDGAALSHAPPAPPRSPGPGGAALRGLLLHTHHAFVALDAMRAGAPAICGKALGLGPAARRELREVRDCLGEDLELARRLHGAGERVVLGDAPAWMSAERSSLAAATDRMTRWMQVLRAHRPLLFPAVPLLFAPVLPLVVAGAALGSAQALMAVGALVVARTALASRLGARLRGVGGAVSLVWLAGEALLLWAFLRSLAQRTVAWRGRTLELGPGGHIRAVWAAPGRAA